MSCIRNIDRLSQMDALNTGMIETDTGTRGLWFTLSDSILSQKQIYHLMGTHTQISNLPQILVLFADIAFHLIGKKCLIEKHMTWFIGPEL